MAYTTSYLKLAKGVQEANFILVNCFRDKLMTLGVLKKIHDAAHLVNHIELDAGNLHAINILAEDRTSEEYKNLSEQQRLTFEIRDVLETSKKLTEMLTNKHCSEQELADVYRTLGSTIHIPLMNNKVDFAEYLNSCIKYFMEATDEDDNETINFSFIRNSRFKELVSHILVHLNIGINYDILLRLEGLQKFEERLRKLDLYDGDRLYNSNSLVNQLDVLLGTLGRYDYLNE